MCSMYVFECPNPKFISSAALWKNNYISILNILSRQIVLAIHEKKCSQEAKDENLRHNLVLLWYIVKHLNVIDIVGNR